MTGELRDEPAACLAAIDVRFHTLRTRGGQGADAEQRRGRIVQTERFPFAITPAVSEQATDQLEVAEVVAKHGEALRSVMARGRAGWPALIVDEDRLAMAIVTAVRGAADVAAALDALAADDLYLAQACALGAPAALAAFATLCDAPVMASLAQMGLARDVVDEVMQQVRTKLFAPPPRIATYSGRASLRSWVRTVATRTAVDRARRQTPAAAEPEVLERVPALQADPELAHFRAKYHGELKVAFEAALATLDVRQRNLLRHHFVDGLTVEAIGALYGVHKTTAFRWIEAARTALTKRTRTGFQHRVKALPSELESILRVLQSHIDLSLSRVLAA
jgi:RNA polymerase sigma-70 factor (ECF subfamily)